MFRCISFFALFPFLLSSPSLLGHSGTGVRRHLVIDPHGAVPRDTRAPTHKNNRRGNNKTTQTKESIPYRYKCGRSDRNQR